MSMWTIAFGIFIGRVLVDCWKGLWEIIDRALTRFMDRKDPNWRYKKHNEAGKIREPIGFKQITIES